MTADSPVLIVVTIGYFAIVLGVSIWGYFHTETEEEFLVAGRSIGPWVGGAVLAATQISAGTYVGTLGRHYLTGVSWTWIWFGVWTGWVISAMFVAPKLRRFGALTVADYIGKRFASEHARTLAAALIIVTYTILLTAQFQAIGEIASAVFGIAPMTAMLALLASTGFYTALGGVRSSSYVEFVQTLIMVMALVFAVPVVLSHVGGLTALGEYVGSIEPRVTGWWFSWRDLIAFGLAFGLSIAAAPYEMTRYYSMRDEATVRYAIGISIGAQVLIGSSVMILGLGMRGLFPYLPSADQASSVMAATVMSPLLGSLFLVAMLSAIMSTVNSILLVTGGAFAHDLYKRLVNPEASQSPAGVDQSPVDRRARLRAVLRRDPQARRRADHRRRAGEVHRQLLLRAGRRRPELAAGDEGRRDLRAWWPGSPAAWRGRSPCSRALRAHGIDAVEVGVVLSAVTFVLVSRMTRPTPRREPARSFSTSAARALPRAADRIGTGPWSDGL